MHMVKLEDHLVRIAVDAMRRGEPVTSALDRQRFWAQTFLMEQRLRLVPSFVESHIRAQSIGELNDGTIIEQLAAAYGGLIDEDGEYLGPNPHHLLRLNNYLWERRRAPAGIAPTPWDLCPAVNEVAAGSVLEVEVYSTQNLVAAVVDNLAFVSAAVDDENVATSLEVKVPPPHVQPPGSSLAPWLQECYPDFVLSKYAPREARRDRNKDLASFEVPVPDGTVMWQEFVTAGDGLRRVAVIRRLVSDARIHELEPPAALVWHAFHGPAAPSGVPQVDILARLMAKPHDFVNCCKQVLVGWVPVVGDKRPYVNERRSGESDATPDGPAPRKYQRRDEPDGAGGGRPAE
jgi:hypothetical protein